MPVMRVPRISGATMTLIRRRKISLKHAELRGESGRVEAELETGEHGEEDPEGERAVAEAGDGEEEKTEAAEDEERFVARKWNQKQAAGEEQKRDLRDKNFELA